MGRAVDDCQAELVSLKVEVLSAEGARVRGATVTGTNVSSNVSITGVTDDQGGRQHRHQRIARAQRGAGGGHRGRQGVRGPAGGVGV
ncbi:hypothetical protein [Myxococcus sp. AM009]|uniref:hypothetical protein n=1 Tax=Myxococcus sp. AM009 TaxID=2745137 RepID=UPI0020CC1034|nr:hypothetical protein [Myxococcus sp. AM009]